MTISISSYNRGLSLESAGLTPTSDPTAAVMIYGAIQACEFDMAAGLTEEGEAGKEFLLGLWSKYSFTDGYAQKTLDDFHYLVSTGGNLKTWWNDLKSLGLKSTDSTQPRISLLTWTESNEANFNPSGLSGDQYLNEPNYTLYSEMFFLQAQKDKSDSPELPIEIDSFFMQTSDSSAYGGALALQIYNSFGQPEPTDPDPTNWNAFSAEITKLSNVLDPTGQKPGIYLVLNGFSSGVVPDPYNTFKDYFADVANGTLAPESNCWSIWNNYEDDAYKALVKDYKKFESDLSQNNANAAVQDYEKIRLDSLAHDAKHEAAENALAAAAKTWSDSININTLLIYNSGGGGYNPDGSTGNLGGYVKDSNGNFATLDEYLNNPNMGAKIYLPEFFYNSMFGNHDGYLAKLDGTKIHDMWPGIYDTDFQDSLNAAFNNNIQWHDNTSAHSVYDMEADGSIANLVNEGTTFYDDATGGAASHTAADTIDQILKVTPE